MLTYIMDEKRKEQMAVATRKYQATDKGAESAKRARLKYYHANKDKLKEKRVPFQTTLYGDEGLDMVEYVRANFDTIGDFIRFGIAKHKEGK